jgi:hypothetical protein
MSVVMFSTDYKVPNTRTMTLGNTIQHKISMSFVTDIRTKTSVDRSKSK